jgi:hypothetical protein
MIPMPRSRNELVALEMTARRPTMATRTIALLLAALILTLILGAARSVSGESVHWFSGHMTADPDIIAWPRTGRLPDGTITMAGEGYRICYRAVEVDPTHDYVSGCWYYTAERLIYPDGTQEVWGESTLQDLVALYPEEGGWDAEFTGNWSLGYPPRNATYYVSARGWGALEGWRLEHTCSMPRDRQPCVAELSHTAE